MKKQIHLGCIAVILLLTHHQNTLAQPDINQANRLKIMFYNVENLYDPFNDTLTDDDEFTPGETRHWNYTRFKKKVLSLSRVIIACGEGELPVLVGMCEIENRFVLNKLLTDSPLNQSRYAILHRDSPDPRGVDVALLYDTLFFQPVNTEFLQVIFAENTRSTTREILYCKGRFLQNDTLHVFVNHWPSNYGGSASSDARRTLTATLVREKTDSILRLNPLASIVIMGDMNEGPDGDNLKLLKNAADESSVLLTDYSGIPAFQGTHKFRGNWEILDHMLFSNGLKERYSPVFQIVTIPFLLEEDEGFTGKRPYRTFAGPTYKGGFSDHLPVLLRIKK